MDMDFDMEDTALLEWPGKSMSISLEAWKVGQKKSSRRKAHEQPEWRESSASCVASNHFFWPSQKLESDGDAMRCQMCGKIW